MDPDMAAIGGILDRVADDVHHDLLQTAAVTGDEGQTFGGLVDQFVGTLLGVQCIGAGHALDGFAEGEAKSQGDCHRGRNAPKTGGGLSA